MVLLKKLAVVAVATTTAVVVGQTFYQTKQRLNSLLPDISTRRCIETVPVYIYPPQHTLLEKLKCRLPWFPHMPPIHVYMVRLARSDNKWTRHKAIHLLSVLSHYLDDGACHEVSQMIDGRAAVALARFSSTDARLLQIYGSLPSEDSDFLVEELLQVVEEICPKFKRLCLRKEEVHFRRHKKDQVQLLLFSLKAVLSCSVDQNFCHKFVNSEGLPLLMSIARLHDDLPEAICTVGKIVANIAIFRELHSYLLSGDWVRLVFSWSRNDDVSMNLPASRALQNLDVDDSLPIMSPGVFQLHPTNRNEHFAKVDVVFVHGLRGGLFRTWRQRDAQAFVDENYTRCWPKDWLPKDCLDVRVLGVDYDTRVSRWSARMPMEVSEKSLSDRSDEMLRKLVDAGVGRRPIVWVSHSMGGILVKYMIVAAKKSNDPSVQRVCDQTKGVVFYAVPHRGSPLGLLRFRGQVLFLPSIEALDLQRNSPRLLELHQTYTNLTKEKKIETDSMIEGLPTLVKPLKLRTVFVDAESANPNFGDIYILPVSHLDICKPAGRNSFVYCRLVKMINKVAETF